MTDTPQQIFVLFQQVLLASYIFIQYIIYIFIHKLRSSIDLRRTYTSHTHTHNVILPNLFSFIRYRLNFFRPIHRRVFVCKFLLYSRMTHSNFIQFQRNGYFFFQLKIDISMRPYNICLFSFRHPYFVFTIWNGVGQQHNQSKSVQNNYGETFQDVCQHVYSAQFLLLLLYCLLLIHI